MNLSKIELKYTETNSADTEIKYSVVSSLIEGADLALLIPPADTAAVQKRIFTQAKRILKDFKNDGRIAFFVTPDNFTKNDTVSQYTFAMFPELEENLPSIETGCDFILVRY